MDIKKDILDIELMDGPRAGDGKAKNNSNGGWFDDWAECLVKINVGLLRVVANNPSSLVASKRAIGIEFVLKDSFAHDNIGIRGLRNQ